MKRKLLFAIAALLCSVTTWSQDPSYPSWIASEVGTGNFHLYNVGKGQFLTRGNGWHTQASTGANALTLTLEEYSGAYKLRTDVNGSGKGLERLSDPVIYTDQSAGGKNSTWTFTKVDDASNGPVYTIVSAANHGGGSGSYMTASEDNTIVGPADAVTDDYGRWQLVQSWITNTMPVINADGWTVSQTPTYDAGNICAEYWNAGGAYIKQTVNSLPAGSYELIAVALTRTGMTATLNAGTNTMSIATVGTDVVNNRNQAKTWFDAGNGVNSLEFTYGGGNLEIGLTADNTSGDHWLVWRSFVLLYKGLDLSEFKAALDAAVAAAEAVEGTVPTAAYNALAAVVAENNNTYATTDDYTNATNAIIEATDAAKALQTNYTRYQNIKTAALGISAAVSTTTADSQLAAATTNDAINTAIATLRAAFLTKLQELSVPVDPGYIDVTSVMVDNAGVRTNTDYWTKEGTPNGGNSFGKCDYNECEFWGANFKFYQTLAMARGTWEFGVTGFHREGNHNTHFYAGEDQILIPGVSSGTVNSMAGAQTYFDAGNGKVSLKFIIESNQNVEIGINNQDTETDKWTIFRDFTLKYYGEPNYSVYDAQWNDAVTAANAAKAANANVTGSELTALNAAIADAPDGSSKANYLEKIQALEAARTTFVAAAPSYNKYVAYRAETVAAFGETLAATVAAPTTAAGALVAVHNLNIAQYNKVADEYTYSATGLIGDFGSWTGTAYYGEGHATASTPNYLSNEHWSGTTHAYYEQCSQGWNDAHGWTIQYQKICTLPAGDYVIKVAARSSGTGVTSLVSCTATDATVTLPAESAYARGIKKDGTAGWEGEDSEYAREGQGYGWQWRFLPFTLDAETEVTMTFYAEASTQYQWMSIADAELLCTTKLSQDVAYDEDDSNTVEDVALADVTMARNIKVGYNTVCVPFNLTAGQVTTAFGAGTTVYAYSENSADANDATINFTRGDGSITANTPVLVNATVASDEQVFNGVQIVYAAEAKVDGTNLEFVGTYAPIAAVAADDYFIGNGALYKSAGATSMKAFRAYIHAKSAGVKAMMFIDGLETSINEIMGNEDNAKAPIFDLSGRRVQKTQKGLYIVNGKKMLVK